MTTKELTEILKVHENTIYLWAKEGMPRIKLSPKDVRYDLDKVMEWLEERNK